MVRSTDPRYFQIIFLLSLLLFGALARDFDIGLYPSIIVLVVTLSTQILLNLFFKLPSHSLLSALISALSIVLLFRSQSLFAFVLVSLLAISSKFIFRFREKHFYNPTNFAIVLMCLLSDKVWISPGQWGNGILLFFWILALGGSILHQVRRYDISLGFLVAYGLCLLLRIGYLGQPLAVLWHQLQSGSLLIYTFFMISDPRSTPNHPMARLLFSIATAGLTYFLRFHAYNANAPLWALFFLSPLTILLDNLFQHSRFEWRKQHGKDPTLVNSLPLLDFEFRPRLLWLLHRQSGR